MATKGAFASVGTEVTDFCRKHLQTAAPLTVWSCHFKIFQVHSVHTEHNCGFKKSLKICENHS